MFRPIALCGYLLGTIAVYVLGKLALGQPTYLNETDIACLFGMVIGWFNHWVWTKP